LEELGRKTSNDAATIVFCKYQPGEKLPFKLHKFPTTKLFKLSPSSKNTKIMEYFGDPNSLEGYRRFLREEGSVSWFVEEAVAQRDT
jgi:hypothetical protein